MTLLQAAGFEVVGYSTDEQVVARIASGEVLALVIGGGVGQASRDRLTQEAKAHSLAMINGS